MNYFKFLKNSFLFLASLFLFSSCQQGSDKIELKLNLQPGDTYLYTTNITQNINSMGMANIKMNFIMEMTYKLLSQKDSVQKLGITYSHLAAKGTSPMGGSFSYDSNQPDANPAVSEMGKMVGKTFYVYLSPNGTLKKVEGLNSLIDTTLGREPIDMPISDTSFTMMMQNAFDLYPGKPVAIGESWEKNTSMRMNNFNFNMKSTYTLESVKDGIAVLSVNSELTLPETAMDNTKGFEMKMKMSGRQNGSIKLDIQSGRIISGETNQNIEGKMSIGDQELPMTINGSIQTSSKKL